MRQTKKQLFGVKLILRVVFLVTLLVVLGNQPLLADIGALDLTVAPAEGDTTDNFNGGINVTLTANFPDADTPPFAATFRKDGVDFKTSNTSLKTAVITTSGLELGEGTHAFAVRVIETSVPNAVPKETSGGSIKIDLTPPLLTTNVTTKTLSKVAPNNTTTFTVSSTNEPLSGQPTVVISPATGITLSAPIPSGISASFYQYTITVDSGAAGGAYNIAVTGSDNTRPAASQNKATVNDSFTVVTAGPAAPTVTLSDPESPTRRTSFTLKGKKNPETITVEAFEGATSLGNATITGEDWSIGVTTTQGEHKYTVVGTDALGNKSVSSTEFKVIVDTTPPTQPLLKQPTSPTSLSQITITGENATDTLTAGVNSPPVVVTLYKLDGSVAKTSNAGDDGKFTFSDVPLVLGQNIFYARAEDQAKGSRGNESANSAVITVVRDGAGSNINSVLLGRVSPVLASQPIPLSNATWLTSGNYSIQITFDEPMATDTNPSIGFTPANGTENVSTTGYWDTASGTIFTGTIAIPGGQGATMDGAATMRIFGAKDVSGNVMTALPLNPAFNIDTTPPVTTLASQSQTLYIGSGTTIVTITGTSVDGLPNQCSGVGYVELQWQDFDNPTGPISSVTVPIFNGPTVTFNYSWTHGLTTGKYKLWAIGADQAQPSPNIEARDTGKFRTVVVDSNNPTISTISFDDLVTDMNPGGVQPTISSDVVKITARVGDVGAGLDFTRVSTQTFILTDPTGVVIDGNFTNNGTDTISFTFPKLTVPGSYTVSVTVWDLAGNQSPTATRGFALDNAGPTSVTFVPPQGRYVNHTNPAINADQVWATVDDVPAILDYTNNTSKFEVTYNGIVAGVQSASATQLVFDLWNTLPAPRVASDQSVDGKYDCVVNPVDELGNAGPVQKSYFYLDTQPPAVKESNPLAGSWFGIQDQRPISTEFSDGPRDQTTYHGAKVSGDGSWYNGTGSGLNLNVASYTLTYFEPVTGNSLLNSSFNINGATLTSYLPSVNITAPGFRGAGSVTVDIRVPDRVNDRSPNIRVASVGYSLDYLRPHFTFTKPLSTGKYCKNTLAMEGLVYDNPTSTVFLRITKAEVSGDGTTWAQVNLAGGQTFPIASGTWNVTADISTMGDGSHTFFGRCFDLGNNQSVPEGQNTSAEAGANTEIAITIDRTPPPPPTLILPLNDSILSKRGILFRWSSEVAGSATRYLHQVSDNQAFTNVLNVTATDTNLPGTVTTTNQATFAVTSDGTYYWRVASIEDCNDGYNISSYSATWRFHIDTVKPKVLEVQPSPSEGNKVTTGMLTFTIRFNEKMDITQVPVVSLTSAGGQYMLIEQVNYRENTWTGTTVIPKNNSPLYDGNAIISITEAKDLAGNAMEADATHQVIINTGPAFETKLFSNPAHEFEIVIVTRSTEALQGPPVCTVSQNGSKVPVVMNFLKEKFYAGSYVIDKENSGKAYIDLSGTDLFGMTGRGSVEFTVANVQPSIRTYLKTDDKMAAIDIPAGAVSKPTSMFIVSRGAVEQPTQTGPSAKVAAVSSGLIRTTSVTVNPELKEVLALEEIGPGSAKFQKPFWYRANVKSLKTSIPLEKIHLYRNDGEKWIFSGGAVKNDQILAPLTGFGRLSLLADLKAPVLVRVSPDDNEKLDDPCPLIEGELSEAGSGIWKESFVLSIDGKPQESVDIDDRGRFSFQVVKPLPKGPHKIEVSISDRAQNTLKQSFSVIAPGPFAIDELQAYPNPARGPAVWITYNLQQKADDINLKIMDTSGHKVAEIDNFGFTARSAGKIKWDLRNTGGDRVSNGVYFFKMVATKNGKKHKAVRKLAVLR